MAWRKIAGCLLLAALVVGLGRYIVRHIDDFKVIRRLGVDTLLIVLALRILMQIVSSFRFYTLARHFGLSLSFLSWFHVFVHSRFLNRFYPQAGNVYRASVLKMDYAFPIANYFAAFAAFLFLDRAVILLTALVLVLAVEPDLSVAGVRAAPVMAIALALAVGATVVLAWLRRRGKQRPDPKSRIGRKANECLNAMIDCLRDPAVLFALVVLGIAGVAVAVYVHTLCFAELGTPLSVARMGLFHTVKSLSQMIAITPGNLGVTEACYGLLGKGMQNVVSNAIIVAAVLNLTEIVAVATLAGLLAMLPRSRRPPRKNIAK